MNIEQSASPTKLPGVSDEALQWLTEPDDPGMRYLALRDLYELPKSAPTLTTAAEQAHREGQIHTVLDAMHPEGYWGEPSAGYYPKYTGSVWSILLLAQLGASVAMDQRILTACEYLMQHALTDNGIFSITGSPSGTADCLQGNLCAAFLDLGFETPRLESAFAWMARSVTGEGIAPMENKHASLRYYAGKCGPVFACGSNNKLPCAWGGVKVMLAFSKLPPERRTPLIQRAIAAGVDFIFSVDPATAAYPCGYSAKPSGNWWKFGFPVFYVTDLLQLTEAMVGLGYGQDPRLANSLALIRQKQDAKGRWSLEYDYTDKTWVDFGDKKQPNKWITLRALRVLKKASEQVTG